MQRNAVSQWHDSGRGVGNVGSVNPRKTASKSNTSVQTYPNISVTSNYSGTVLYAQPKKQMPDLALAIGKSKKDSFQMHPFRHIQIYP